MISLDQWTPEHWRFYANEIARKTRNDHYPSTVAESHMGIAELLSWLAIKGDIKTVELEKVNRKKDEHENTTAGSEI